MHKSKVAITMREIIISGEKHSAISNSWLKFAELVGIELVFIPINDNEFLSKIQAADCKALILSGGGDLDQHFEFSKENFYSNKEGYNARQHVEFELINYFSNNKMPILSVCRGMQVLNVYYGGTISAISGHLNVESKFDLDDLANFSFLPAKAICHHNYGISRKELAEDFVSLMSCKGMIEGMASVDKLKLGFMWHPERNLESFSKEFIKYIQFFLG